MPDIRKLEAGDADSSGSTVRTLMVVTTVTVLLPIFVLAVMRLGTAIATRVNAVP